MARGASHSSSFRRDSTCRCSVKQVSGLIGGSERTFDAKGERTANGLGAEEAGGKGKINFCCRGRKYDPDFHCEKGKAEEKRPRRRKLFHLNISAGQSEAIKEDSGIRETSQRPRKKGGRRMICAGSGKPSPNDFHLIYFPHTFLGTSPTE